jgi:hypothetical protein
VTSKQSSILAAHLADDVVLEDATVGDEFLLRVRLVTVREESIEITRYEDVEPQIAQGRNTGELILLAVRPQSNQEESRDA